MLRSVFLLLTLLLPRYASAQTPGAPAPPVEATPAPLPPPLSAEVHVSSLYDTNIHHVADATPAYGANGGVLLGYTGLVRTLTLGARYEGEAYAFTGTTRWNRFSHRLRLSAGVPLGHALHAETALEGSHLAVSEDRDLANQLSLAQSLLYQRGNLRLGLYGALRLKQYTEGEKEVAYKPHVGVSAEHRAGPHRLRADVRRELNSTGKDAGHYTRWRYAGRYTLALGAHRLEAQGTYRYKPYTYRRVEVAGALVRRLDHQWMLGAGWQAPVGRTLSAAVSYTFQAAHSNDGARTFGAHLLSVTLVRPL